MRGVIVALSTSRRECTIEPMPELDPLHPVTPRDERLLPWRAFLVAHARITRRLDEELRVEHDLSLGEYDALLALAESSDRRLRMNTLADRVVLSKSGVTRLIDRLVADGLVVPDQCLTDARGAEAVLTEKGLERLRRASRTHLRGIERHFFDVVDEADLGALRRAMVTVAEHAETANRPAAEPAQAG